MSRAAVAPDVVCSDRSVPAPSPSTGWPVVLLSRIAPVPEPVTVMSFQRLVSRLVLAASSAFAPVVAIVLVAVFANSTRSALLIRTPIAVALPPLVTVTPVKRLTPVVPSISMPGCVPAVPVSVTLTFWTVTASVPGAAADAAAGAGRVDVDAVDERVAGEHDDVLVGWPSASAARRWCPGAAATSAAGRRRPGRATAAGSRR